MNFYSNLYLHKTGESEDFLANFWNNLITAMTIMNEVTTAPKTDMDVTINGTLLDCETPDLGLKLFNSNSSWSNIRFRYSNLEKGWKESLETSVATTSALEYIVDREESLEIESWFFLRGSTETKYPDIGVDCMASALEVSREYAIDLFEKRVEPELDEIEKACL